MRSRTLMWSYRSSLLCVSLCLLCIALPGPAGLVVFFSATSSSRNTVSSKAWNVFSRPFSLCFFPLFCLVLDLAQHFFLHPPTQFPYRHTHSISIFWSGFALLLRICLKSLGHLYSSSVLPKLSAVLSVSPQYHACIQFSHHCPISLPSAFSL